MTKTIHTLAILLQLAFATSGFCNQEKLDAERTRKLQTVFESIHHSNPAKLATCLPGLSEEEASRILKTISGHWGDTTKLVNRKTESGLDDKLIKGDMIIVAHWGTDPTQIGRWMDLKNPACKRTVMRIGLHFAKGSSEASQFSAVEWDVSGIARNERPHEDK